jgi:hypothetical protein
MVDVAHNMGRNIVAIWGHLVLCREGGEKRALMLNVRRGQLRHGGWMPQWRVVSVGGQQSQLPNGNLDLPGLPPSSDGSPSRWRFRFRICGGCVDHCMLCCLCLVT